MTFSKSVAIVVVVVLAAIGTGVGAVAAGSTHAGTRNRGSHETLSSAGGRGGTGTGTSMSGGVSRQQASGLCASIPALEELVMHRHVAFPQNHQTYTIPASVTVGEAAAVQHAAGLLCGLALMPKGVFSCPADFETTYRFTFSSPKSAFRAVILDPTGCETVSGLGALRWAETAPASFWSSLGRALGVDGSTRSSFAGSPPQ